MKQVTWLALFLSLGGLLALAGPPAFAEPKHLSSMPGPDLPHHTDRGFRNPWPDGEPARGFRDFLKWRSSHSLARGSYADNVGRFPVDEPDWSIIEKDNGELRLTWIGHATFLVQIGGLNILTDPQLSERASPVPWAGPRRITQPAIPADQLPPIDVVVISHNHYDHLDLGTVKLLGNGPAWYVPLGLSKWFAKQNITNVIELDWWDHVARADGLTITSVPSKHFSARTPWDRNRTLWASWVLEANGQRVYFAGDTGYGPHFKQTGERIGPIDVALLPIGAYAPRWFMGPVHINPAEAVQAHFDLRAERSIAMHWGTFILSQEPTDEPPVLYRAAAEAAGLTDNQAIVLRHGETVSLP